MIAIDIYTQSRYHSLVQNIFSGGILVINKTKLKLGLDIARINHVISRKVDAAIIHAIDDNLTVSQAHVIDFISMEGDNRDIFQKDLEKIFDIRRSSVSTMISSLEKKGYIRRESIPTDKRINKIVLTEAGIKSHIEVDSDVKKYKENILENFSDEEIELLYDLLERFSKKTKEN